jgi:hypothetical protein
MRLLEDYEMFKVPHVVQFQPNLTIEERYKPTGTHFVLGSNLDISFGKSGDLSLPGLWALRLNETFQFLGGEVFFALDYFGQCLGNLVANIHKVYGDLSYIDGCSNSILLAPPRNGDPCMNLMYMPPGVNQTWHVHPTIRIGAVVHGQGVAESRVGGTIIRTQLHRGSVFVIQPMELHHFKTEDNDLAVVVFHPDSEGGPQDAYNPMFSRTYVKGVEGDSAHGGFD